MHERNQSVASQTIFWLNEFQNFFVKNEKKLGLNYQIYDSTISFAYFETFFLKILTVKNFTSKYAKLLVQSCICDNLNQIYKYFSFLTK